MSRPSTAIKRKEVHVALDRSDRTADIERADRIRGAIWGQLVGDAAALGTHWIYDLEEQSSAYPDGVVGFEEPRPGHYHDGKHPGDQTHYGDGALLLLESISAHGAFEPRHFGESFVAKFREGAYHGYLDHATRGTVERYDDFVRDRTASEFDFQDGADDDQPATQTRLSILVGRYDRAAKTDLLDLVQSLTLVAQHNGVAVSSAKFSALLLGALLDGSGVDDAVGAALDDAAGAEPDHADRLRRQVNEARAAVQLDTTEATLRFGQSCPLEHSLPASLQVLLKYPEDFEKAILATVRAGGDNAARAAIVGGWLGAHLGVAGVPEHWRQGLTNAARISEMVDVVVADALGQPQPRSNVVAGAPR
jgi:ADP-ribosylglycohydrolase